MAQYTGRHLRGSDPFSRISVVGRLLVQSFVAIAVALGLRAKPELLEQLLTWDVVPITAVAAVGFPLHVAATMRQWLAGRWKTDAYESLTGQAE